VECDQNKRCIPWYLWGTQHEKVYYFGLQYQKFKNKMCWTSAITFKLDFRFVESATWLLIFNNEGGYAHWKDVGWNQNIQQWENGLKPTHLFNEDAFVIFCISNVLRFQVDLLLCLIFERQLHQRYKKWIIFIVCF
jgi:hypothetical protein